MYLFKVTFYNRDLLEDVEEALKIDTAGVDMTEREVYILAMERAYDKAVAMGAALMASFAYDTGAKTGAGDTQAAGGGAFPSLGGSTNFEAEDGKTYEVIVKCTKSYGLICLDENDQRRHK